MVGEVQNNTVTASYLRGVNLISRTAGTTTEYYLFNAHGDVVNLVNTDGAVIKIYNYDAFGNETPEQITSILFPAIAFGRVLLYTLV